MIHFIKVENCVHLQTPSRSKALWNEKEESSKDKQIKKTSTKRFSWNIQLKILKTFMIRKAFEIKSLKKGDKGNWIVDSEMVIELKDKKMEFRSMVLDRKS